MTRYTELRHAGYYQADLSDADRNKIAAEVDKGVPRTETPAESTVFQTPVERPAATKKAPKK